MSFIIFVLKYVKRSNNSKKVGELNSVGQAFHCEQLTNGQTFHEYNQVQARGKNGSGKSSLLQAIVLGLMSGTKHVGRYSRLGDFVRKGSQRATIAVTLHNTGDEAYRQERYGRSLTFRRTICLKGLSTLELVDWKGSVIVSGRAALQEAANILRALNIQLENPLTILQQDHAKEMLQVEKPEGLDKAAEEESSDAKKDKKDRKEKDRSDAKVPSALSPQRSC